MNIILIVIDSLRSDHLGVNGYGRDTSPNIDRLAKEGVFFPNAICTVPRTRPSIASILTGLYPHSHGLRFTYDNRLISDITTLQEILQAHGYKTIGYDVDMENTVIGKGFHAFNLLQWKIINKIRLYAKKSFNWAYNPAQAEILTDFAIRYIEKLKDEKFFFYLHYSVLHWPYSPPKPYDEMFDPDYKGEHAFKEFNGTIKRGELIFNNQLPKEENEHAISHYDGAIRYTDFHIDRLLRYVNEIGLAEKTLVILCADHGECFGEHNLFFEHGEYLYDEGIRVPLILKCSKLPKKIIQTQVQLTDIMPTILDLLGIELIEKIDGVSLVPLIKNSEKVREYTYSETDRSFYEQNKRIYFKGIKGKWRSIRSDEWKLIYIPHPDKDIYELYNLKNDPVEKKNLIEEEKKQADIMKRELFKWIKDLGGEEEKDLTEKSKKLLKKLGYID